MVVQTEHLEGSDPALIPLQLQRHLGLQQVHRIREKLMQVFCNQKADSNLPLCAIHNVVLRQNQIAIDANAPSLGRITCFVCPISHSVVREMRRANAFKSH